MLFAKFLSKDILYLTISKIKLSERKEQPRALPHRWTFLTNVCENSGGSRDLFRVRKTQTDDQNARLPACFVKVFQIANKAFSFSLIHNRILFKYIGHNAASILIVKRVHEDLKRVYSSEIVKDRRSRTNTINARGRYQTRNPHNVY